ncbi:sensor histidine kinase [Actinomadura harenae]|uniref:sensor histidine kinase n=1 Tax=Actinomadura harenae TaxID=2483351 RepID=UPI00131507E4|nr:nitrate- and nitrite sensing domain-containing protein [Actinomadura harenae]
MLALVPLVSLVALWAFVTTVLFGDANSLLQGGDFQNKLLLPTQRLIVELQKERRLTEVYIGSHGTRDQVDLSAQRDHTDTAANVVREGASDRRLRGTVGADELRAMDALAAKTRNLPAVRRAIDGGNLQRPGALAEFAAVIDAGFSVYNNGTPGGDGTLAVDARTLTALARAHEFLSREDALLAGALAAGRVTAAERGEFARLSGAQRTLYADTAPMLTREDRLEWSQIEQSPVMVQLRQMEDRVVQNIAPGERRLRRGAPPVDDDSWRSASEIMRDRLYKFENQVLDHIIRDARGVGMTVFFQLGVAGGLGLVAIVTSSIIAWRVARRLVEECRRLASQVGDFARNRLPVLTDAARHGKPFDLADALGGEENRDYRILEIRRISSAFVRTRDAVLTAAAGELAARRGVNEVFVNLARRNQALLHRQLGLLDTLERRTEDPAELADLFKLDHLATRMRRHAEGLVILAGKHAGRGWRNPVPLVDVVRGAVAEVEDYPRVRVQPLPRLSVVGSAVTDVVHLLAEIVENATAFSPPGAPVLVTGHRVGHGLAVEVEDRGLGMDEAALADANSRLSDPPDFDPADSARLGLAIVGRLAIRHDIKVTLRPSPYGGTTAIALLPDALLVDNPEPVAISRRPTGSMTAAPLADGSGPARGRVAVAPAVRLVADPAGDDDAHGPVRAPEARPEPPVGPDGLPRRRRKSPDPTASVRPSGVNGSNGVNGVSKAAGDDPARTVKDAVPSDGGSGGDPRDTGPNGLPRRKRQTHLAPQLRDRVDSRLASQERSSRRSPDAADGGYPAAPHVAPGDLDAATTGPLPIQADAPEPGPSGLFAAPVPTGPGEDDRSPEALRSMFSAMQAGWQRGRAEGTDTPPFGTAPSGGDAADGASGHETRAGHEAGDAADPPRTDPAAPGAAQPPDAAHFPAAGREDANTPAAPTGTPEPTTSPTDQEDRTP